MALWRVFATFVAALVIGLVAGPWLVRVGEHYGPAVSQVITSRVIPPGHPALSQAGGEALVMSALVFPAAFFLGWLFRSGRMVAGTIFGLALTAPLWTRAFRRFVDEGSGSTLSRLLLTALEAAVVCLVAAIAFDSGRRFRRDQVVIQ